MVLLVLVEMEGHAVSRCPANYWEPGLGPCICEGRHHKAEGHAVNIPPKGSIQRSALEIGVRWRQLWREIGRQLVAWSQGKRRFWFDYYDRKDTP